MPVSARLLSPLADSSCLLSRYQAGISIRALQIEDPCLLSGSLLYAGISMSHSHSPCHICMQSLLDSRAAHADSSCLQSRYHAGISMQRLQPDAPLADSLLYAGISMSHSHSPCHICMQHLLDSRAVQADRSCLQSRYHAGISMQHLHLDAPCPLAGSLVYDGISMYRSHSPCHISVHPLLASRAVQADSSCLQSRYHVGISLQHLQIDVPCLLSDSLLHAGISMLALQMSRDDTSIPPHLRDGCSQPVLCTSELRRAPSVMQRPFGRQTELKQGSITSQIALRGWHGKAKISKMHAGQKHSVMTSFSQQFLFLVFWAGFADSGRSWLLFGIFGDLRLRNPVHNGNWATLQILSFNGTSRTLWWWFPSSTGRPRPSESSRERGAQRKRSAKAAFLARSLAQSATEVRRRQCGTPSHSGTRPSAEAQRTYFYLSPSCLHRHVPAGDRRAIHPQRGTRIGEAATPGPDTVTPPTAATTDASTENAPNAGVGPETALQDVPIRIKMATGRDATLQCRWMPRTASWRWWTGSGDNRLQHQGRGTPATILKRMDAPFRNGGVPRRAGRNQLCAGLRPLPASLPGAPPPTPGEPEVMSARVGNAARLPATPLPSYLTPVADSQMRVDPPEAPPDISHDFSRCRGCPFWIGNALRTQRSVPASTLQIVDSVCAAILARLNDPLSSPESRRVLLAMALVMPRWLWPEPPKPPGTNLPPRARPRLLQARAQLFLDGDLPALLAFLQEPDQGQRNRPLSLVDPVS